MGAAGFTRGNHWVKPTAWPCWVNMENASPRATVWRAPPSESCNLGARSLVVSNDLAIWRYPEVAYHPHDFGFTIQVLNLKTLLDVGEYPQPALQKTPDLSHIRHPLAGLESVVGGKSLCCTRSRSCWSRASAQGLLRSLLVDLTVHLSPSIYPALIGIDLPANMQWVISY